MNNHLHAWVLHKLERNIASVGGAKEVALEYQNVRVLQRQTCNQPDWNDAEIVRLSPSVLNRKLGMREEDHYKPFHF